MSKARCVGCGKELESEEGVIDPERCTEDGEPLCYECSLDEEAGVLGEPS